MPTPNQTPTPFNSGRFTGISNQGGAYVYNPPEEHLVAGRLRELQSRNNPLVANARARALRRANARGDVNSSYSAGAAETAAMEAMLPVAMQDSDTLTRVNIQNAQNAAERAIAEANANAAQGSAAVGAAMAAAERDNARMARDLQLQMQRESLAFQGEQAGYGRQHDFDMFERQMGRDLTLGERQFLQQLAMNEQGFGFNRQLQEDAYGQDLGRMGMDWQMQRDLGNQQGDWQARIMALGDRYAAQDFQRGFYQNIFMSGMQNPYMLGDPAAFDGIMNLALGGVPGSAADAFWSSVFPR